MSVLERLPRARRNLVLGLLGALFLWMAWWIRAVLNPLILGYLLAYVLHPLVARLERRGRSRKAAVNLIFVAGALVTLLILAGFATEAARLGRDVFQNEEIRTQLGYRLREVRDTLQGLPFWPEDLELADPALVIEWIRQNVLAGQEGMSAAQTAGEVGVRAAGGVWTLAIRLVGGVASLAGLLFLVPLYTWFLLFELDRIHTFVGRYVPARDRAQVARIGGQIGEILANFFRGRLLVCVLKGTILTAGLLIAGVDYAFLFGMGSGLLSLVPVVGPLVGWACAFLVGIIEHGVLMSLVRTGIVFWAAEMLEGYVLIPKVLGESLGLHPVVVLFAVLAGGSALGVFGMLVALPLCAALVILVRELVLPALGRFADEAPGSG